MTLMHFILVSNANAATNVATSYIEKDYYAISVLKELVPGNN